MKTVLITGASSGIGYELGKIYAENGYNLVLAARRSDKLRNLKDDILKNINSNLLIEIISVDLAEDRAAYKLFDVIKSKDIEIDILINNAGAGMYGEFAEYSSEQMEKNDRMINLNIKSVVELTKLFLDDMIKKDRGSILNVSSIAGFQPGGPLMANYYASKAYILSFSEALREELRKMNVTISVLCPGPTITEFEKSSNLTGSGLFSKFKTMTAKEVAEIAYRDFTKKKRIIIPGFMNKLAALGAKILPRRLTVKLVRKLQEIKDK